MYNGNELLRAKGEQIEYTPEMVEEWTKCSEDYLYFIEKYVTIDNNDGELVTIKLYDYQKRLLKMVDGDKLVISKMSRQVGKTTSMACYIVWAMIFKRRFKVGVAADKNDTALEIVDRIKIAYENIPYWMQSGVEKWDAHKIRFENGSRIDSTATTVKAFRGKSLNLLLCDEFAHVDETIAVPFYTSVYPTVEKGKNSKMVIISTPKGMNLFYKIYSEAESGKNAFKYIDIKWNEPEGRDEAWRLKTLQNMDEDKFSQEFEGNFVGSSTTLIPPTKLITIPTKNPIKTYDDLKIYEMVQPDHFYFISVDVCRGKGLDYHAFCVTDITELPYRLVAVYHNNTLDTMLYPSVIFNVAKTYNNAYVLVELNDAGKQVSDILAYELEYENMLSTKSNGRAGQILSVESGYTMGFTMSKPVKTIGCANLKSLIMNNRFIFYDYDLKKELTTFEIIGGQYKASPGQHDDIVMACVGFSWAATQPYFMDLTDMNIRQEMFEKRIQQMEEDLAPVGVFGDLELDVTDINNF